MLQLFVINVRYSLASNFNSFDNSNKLATFDVSNVKDMILSFGSKETEKIWNGIRVKKIPLEIQNIGRRKLRMLNNSQDISDLRIPPSNRLEKLTGNLSGFYSIRINKQWRIIFVWENGNASETKIMDYH
tara:strand:+ start:3671 stop:4060 length:390 start_codon:yes stop_codon:yes gene_type:complete